MTAAAEGAGTPAAHTAAAIAAAVGGTLDGNGQQEVTRVAGLDTADAASLSFFADRRYADEAAQSRAGTILVTRELAERVAHAPARIIVAAPQQAMLAALPVLYPPVPPVPGVHATAVIGERVVLGDGVSIGARVVIGDGAVIGARCRIGPGCVIGAGVVMGDDCILHANVTAYTGAVLGDRVQLQSGVVIAGDGFGYAFQGGAHRKIPHVGRAVLEHDVEVGANSTIDRGSVGDTVIGAGTKIDNLVMVGHNVRIGKLCLLMAQVGVSGSVRVGDGVIIAGQAGLAGHLSVGDGARIAAQAGVIGDVPAGETWSGYPARPHREALRAQAALRKLPDLLRAQPRGDAGGTT